MPDRLATLLRAAVARLSPLAWAVSDPVALVAALLVLAILGAA